MKFFFLKKEFEDFFVINIKKYINYMKFQVIGKFNVFYIKINMPHKNYLMLIFCKKDLADFNNIFD